MTDLANRFAQLSPNKRELLALEINKLTGTNPSPSAATGGQRLVAYIVPRQKPAPSVSELREYLADQLPESMIPPSFVILDELPLSPNGKVDRQALPAPDGSRPDLMEDFVAPRNAIEKTLTEIWSQILQIERVGIHDNFFELGGHSLLATKLTFRLQEAFNVEVPLRRLFETPTVAGLSLAIVEMQAEQTDDERLSQVLGELMHMSDDQVRALLAEQD